MLESLLNGRYKLVRILGSGGFGQTFIAEDSQHPERLKCVVKQFKPVSRDSVFLEVARRMFFSEVEVLRRLGSHDRIPELLNDFEDDGQFYLVQEYIQGRPLNEQMAILHRLSEADVMNLLRDILEVLEFVHSHNVIHRDIKPSNLILRKQDGRAVLIDFGAVKEITTQLVQVPGETKLTVGIATQGYGPSEQLAGRPRYNSDLYALGMTAIQALTGLYPAQLPTHPTTGEVVWRDRAKVSRWLAAILDKMVAYHFNQRFQSATEVLEALDQTAIVQPTDMQGLKGNQDTTAITPALDGRETTLAEAGISFPATTLAKPRVPSKVLATLTVGCASLVVTGLVVGARSLGWLQPLELFAYDRLVQIHSSPTPDPRLLVVGISEADIQTEKKFPLSDRTIAQTIQQLQKYQPRAIGLDLFRDIAQEPGRAELLTALKAPNVVAITNLDTPITPPPPGVPPERVGFNDVVLDSDSVIRRNMVFANVGEQSFFSFSLRLALIYLAKEGVTLQPSPGDRTIAKLGAELVPLHSNSGGYRNLDDRGYQILLNYHGRTVAQQISVADVLQGRVKPEQVKGKVVLIGTTAANAKDLFLTPFSPTEQNSPRAPGVMIHAQMVSQFLRTALDQEAPFWFWSDWAEIVWIAGWAVAGGSLAWFIIRRPFLPLLGEPLLLVGLVASSFFLFTQNGWIPVVAPAIALLLCSGIVLICRIAPALSRQSIASHRKP